MPDDIACVGTVRRFEGRKIDIRRSSVSRAGTRGQDSPRLGYVPDPAGEGKSTTTVGLADSLARAGHRATIALREPSLGPILGMKERDRGRLLPSSSHGRDQPAFTGDFHAITSANNADGPRGQPHIPRQRAASIRRRMTFKRGSSIPTTAPREVIIGLCSRRAATGRLRHHRGLGNGVFCLATDLDDLRERLGRITFGYSYYRRPVTVADLGVQVTMLLKDAINSVQTIAGTPALAHGRPVRETSGAPLQLAHRHANGPTARRHCVTEAGFGADLGAEKYMTDPKLRIADVAPSAVVVVATIRALNQGAVLKGASQGAGRRGARGRRRELETACGTCSTSLASPPLLQSTNRDGHNRRTRMAAGLVRPGGGAGGGGRLGHGGDGGDELAAKVAAAAAAPSDFRHVYPVCGGQDPHDRTGTWCHGVRTSRSLRSGASGGDVRKNGGGNARLHGKDTASIHRRRLPVGRPPRGCTVHVRGAISKTGSGLHLVALTGAVMTMPGLPKQPRCEWTSMSMEIQWASSDPRSRMWHFREKRSLTYRALSRKRSLTYRPRGGQVLTAESRTCG